MNTYKTTQPPQSFTQYMNQRQWLALGYIFTAGTDILTTYFGITNYGLTETIPWTQYLIQQWGWEATILRLIVFSVFFVYLFRYQPNFVFKYTRYPSWIILAAYFGFTTLNNLILILG